MPQDTIKPALKRGAEIVTYISVIFGGLAGLIVFFGGSFPPWQTPAAAQEQRREAAQLNKDTAQTLARINTKLDGAIKRLDANDCNAQLQNLEQAQTVLSKKPDDPIAKLLRGSAQQRIREIQGCGQ